MARRYQLFFSCRVVLAERSGKDCEDESASDRDVKETDLTFHYLESIKYPSVEHVAKDAYLIAMGALKEVRAYVIYHRDFAVS